MYLSGLGTRIILIFSPLLLLWKVCEELDVNSSWNVCPHSNWIFAFILNLFLILYSLIKEGPQISALTKLGALLGSVVVFMDPRAVCGSGLWWTVLGTMSPGEQADALTEDVHLEETGCVGGYCQTDVLSCCKFTLPLILYESSCCSTWYCQI